MHAPGLAAQPLACEIRIPVVSNVGVIVLPGDYAATLAAGLRSRRGASMR